MSSYAELQTQIALELARDDLTTPIATAVQAAIRHYQRTLMLFSQATQTIATVASTRDYALEANFVQLDFVQLTDASGTYTLRYQDYEQLATRGADGDLGEPTDYAYRNYQLRFYPIPDAVYSVTVYYWQAKAAPSAGADSTTWSNDLLDLIKQRAKVDLAVNLLRDDQGGAVYRAAEIEVLDGILAQRDRLLTIGGTLPTQF